MNGQAEKKSCEFHINNMKNTINFKKTKKEEI